MSGVLVLNPEMARVKPGAVVVVRAAADDHRDGIRVIPQTGHDFARPADVPAVDRLRDVNVQ